MSAVKSTLSSPHRQTVLTVAWSMKFPFMRQIPGSARIGLTNGRYFSETMYSSRAMGSFIYPTVLWVMPIPYIPRSSTYARTWSLANPYVCFLILSAEVRSALPSTLTKVAGVELDVLLAVTTSAPVRLTGSAAAPTHGM